MQGLKDRLGSELKDKAKDPGQLLRGLLGGKADDQ